MKKWRNFMLIFALVGGLVLTGCSNDDGGGTPPPTEDDDQGGNPGEDADLGGALTEDRTLDASVQYRITAPFLVKDGVTLTIPAGTEIVSETGTDRYIAVEQGGKIDIQGTASNPVVMRTANSNPGDWGGLLLCGKAPTTEGVGAIAEVGGLVYGGTDPMDNSGTINYLIIRGAGAQINSESQYNGLTLYSVGSGTTITNVAMIDGADDGVEYFGGTVSTSGMFFQDNEDDSVDWTEGWNGEQTNSFVIHNNEGFSTAVEADGDNGNPRLTNFTAISTVGGTALQFKKESGATITGLSLTGYDTSIDMRDDGPLANVIIDGEVGNPDLNYTVPPTVDINDFAWVQASVDPQEELLQGTLSGTRTLDPAVNYLLNSSYIVQDGGKLIIPAGTKITARDGGTSVYLAVLQGGQIEINGTDDNPVVMSTEDETPGGWGGLVICGKAPTTEGVGAIAEIGGFVYGGNDPADDSGNVNYLVILGTGAQINSESQYNGVSLYSVGTGTELSNIAVINGADDGVEFFGGTANGTDFYFADNEDDSVDWTEGWNGTVTNLYTIHDINGFSTAVEADGDNFNPTLNNYTAISSTGGTALQFKKESGATFNNIYLEGYTTNVDMRDDGPVSNIIVDGVPMTTVDDDVFNGTPIDISGWNWINARL